MSEPRCLACRSASTKRGVRSPCPRYSAATVTPAIPHVGMRTPPNHDSNTRSTTRAAKTSASKAPNQVNPGWSTEGGSAGGRRRHTERFESESPRLFGILSGQLAHAPGHDHILEEGPQGPLIAQPRDDRGMHADLSLN